VKKELRPFHDHVTCDVCGRTILKGERTEAYLAPGGERHAVCELCFVRAEHAGWIRESGRDEIPLSRPRPQERRRGFGRLRRRGSEAAANGRDAPQDPFETAAAPEPPAPTEERAKEGPQDPRHVRGVPTTAEVKVERALELFNGSEHKRTVAGLARSLGPPWVSAQPDLGAPSTVTVVVAWELSWYRYRVDLGDASDPVSLNAKGDEIEDIDQSLRLWNAGLDADGRVVIGVPQE